MGPLDPLTVIFLFLLFKNTYKFVMYLKFLEQLKIS